MKMVLVTHGVRENDGQSGVNYEVVRAALRRGWHITLLATFVTPQLLEMPEITWVKISLGKLPTKLLAYQVFAIKSAVWLRRHRKEFDIVQVNGFITWSRSDVNAVHFVHNGWLNSGYYPFSFFKGLYSAYQTCFTRLNAILEKRAFANSRVIVAVSDRVSTELRDAGVKTDIEVIYNGSDIAGFANALPNRIAFNLPKKKFLCLFVGDLRITRKNLETVLQALVQVNDRVELVVGGTTKGSPYPAMVESLGLGKRVHFLGHVNDMRTLMASVDCLVFPSRYDPFALVVLEAMAAGLPVVTSSKVGAAALVRKCGVVLENPDDVTGLAQAITDIEGDPKKRNWMHHAAKAEALNYTWELMGEQYVDLYDRLMRGDAALGRHSPGSVSEKAAKT
ncbi:glycosyltransferase family 4 protein [Robbsia sp. Bb-Pol-6]|uniref:Glycosyltransferase family 4 protein n=1 Tax=Robbsia betulipollinis TaxID=2981849 RepID=A0ABT3ZTA3_9BURK|nr:glycosyltransferase family 4 protein [Robbsia betulipollinis]MCY0389784.1 glycosyltransferase family 4 protein [Robbsia betulipollinis]